MDNRSYVHLQTRKNKLNYIVEKSGYFVNPELFDVTAGTQRF
jgi:hypothetical protein